MYVGSSLNVKQRLRVHILKLKKSKHENRYMQNRFNKYTINKCTYCLLEECSADTRLYREKHWIDILSPDLNSKMNPVTQTNSKTQSKIVYQYSLNGDYIGYFPSASEAARFYNLENSSISACCRGKLYKSAGGFQWSYVKKENINYTNNSKFSKIKKVIMYTKLGKKIKTFDSIVDAAKYILETGDDIASLSATISSAAKNTNYSVKDKFIYSYEEKNNIIYTGTKNFPVLEEKKDGTKILWNSTSQISKVLGLKTLYIMRVIKGERKSYNGSIWSDARLKQGELLETPTNEDNQQPSLGSNTLEGSTTNNRVLPDNAEDSNVDTSALQQTINIKSRGLTIYPGGIVSGGLKSVDDIV